MAQEDNDHLLVISSIRSDPDLLLVSANNAYSPDSSGASQFYMLRLHLDRMLAAARAFDWPAFALSILSNTCGLEEFSEALSAHLSGPYRADTEANPVRIRIQLDQRGALSFISAPIPRLPSLDFLFP